ncbi:MAG: PD40 domain-containing protein [Acidobacteria bacterium]|nr:PD40 domain-containing protein [Acidobacteriota bacterium]
MRNSLMAAVFLITASGLAGAQAALQVETIKFSTPATVAEIDIDDLKGQPSRLAWSADARQLYLQTMNGNFGQADARLYHYVLDAASGEKKKVDAQPDWASAYWTEKSGQASPGAPAFKINLKSETRTQKTVSAPMGGDLARGGAGGESGSSTGDALSAAYNQAPVPVHTMWLAGETIGEFINTVIVPGQTFGWGPKGSGVVAFSAQKGGRVVVMNEKGTKREIDGTKDSTFPAWSADGQRIAWLEKDGKKKYELKVAVVKPQ